MGFTSLAFVPGRVVVCRERTLVAIDGGHRGGYATRPIKGLGSRLHRWPLEWLLGGVVER